MKKELRVSAEKDYIAVDIVDETKPGLPILSTPVYLAKNKPKTIRGFDQEQNKWLKTEITFDGTKIKCKDIDRDSDCQGMEFEITPNDLIDPEQFKY